MLSKFWMACCIHALAFQPSFTDAQREPPCAARSGEDQAALLCFKRRLHNSSYISTWGSRNLTSWRGIRFRRNRVVEVDLSYAGLSGDISWPFWCRLSSLERLTLSGNAFTGVLQSSSSSCSLPVLNVLALNNNLLSGGIPAAFSTFTELSFLDLRGNRLSGSIPASIFSIPNLEVVALGGNNLTGSIPTEIGNCSSLLTLSIVSTLILGHIPSSMGQLTRLKFLELFNNELTGEVPDSLGNCTQLRLLDLRYNSFTGHIPRSIFALESLEFLQLSVNNFSGELRIPKNTSSLRNLKVLTIAGNQLKGPLPHLGTLRRLKFLDLQANSFSGSLPDSMSSLSDSLQYLALVGNQLSGSLPRWLGNFTKIRTLDFWKNSLTGSIPPELANITSFQRRNLTDEQDPDTKDLQLSMIFTPTGGSDTKSTLDYSFSAYPKTLDLCDNQFSGSIPPQLGSLRNLDHLWLCGNNLSGTIPASLSNAANLILLQLYDNKLTGRIPRELGGLSFLSYFNVSSNQLSGPIPRNGQLGTFNDPSAFLGNLQLCGPPLNASCQTSAAPRGKDKSATHEEDQHEIPIGIPVAVGALVGFVAGLLSIFLLSHEALVLLCHKLRIYTITNRLIRRNLAPFA